METKDLSSYYPGYDSFAEGKVPYDDYAEIEEKIEKVKKSLNELEEVVYNEKEYSLGEMVKLTKAILEDMRKEL